MMEVLNFFATFPHFLGLIVVMGTIGIILVNMIEAWRKP